MKVKVNGKIKRYKTIGEMEAGDFGFAVPWAYNPDTGNLNKKFSVFLEPGGTAEMAVCCNGEDDYEITIPPNYRY